MLAPEGPDGSHAESSGRLPGPAVTAVTAVALDPATQRAATGHSDGVVRVWDIDEARCTASVKLPDRIGDIVFHADGVHVVTMSDDRVVRMVDVTARTLEVAASFSSRVLHFVSLWRSGQRHRAVARSFDNHLLRIIDLDRHMAPVELRAPGRRFGSCQLLADEAHVLSVIDDTFLELWSEGGRAVRTVMDVELRPPLRLVTDAQGRYAVVGGADGLVCACDIETGTPLFTAFAHDGPVVDLALDETAAWLATAGEDGVVRLFCGRTGRALADWKWSRPLERCAITSHLRGGDLGYRERAGTREHVLIVAGDDQGEVAFIEGPDPA